MNVGYADIPLSNPTGVIHRFILMLVKDSSSDGLLHANTLHSKFGVVSQ